MATSCEIKFDQNPHGVYFPGQTLAGSVELRLAEVTKVRGVALQISGVAEVKWSESTGTGKNRRTTYYRGRQDYLHSTTYLAGSKEGNNIELLPGIHTYRFSCALPHNLVTSVEAQYGYVRYTVKVVLERSWKMDQSYKVAFTILRHVNLNEEAYEVRYPGKMEKSKTFCCGPCRSDPMYISAETPISGYVPGQTIAVKINVDNQSTKRLNEISTKLLYIASFISQTPHTRVKTIPSIIAEKRCAGLGPNEKGSFEQHLQIPPLPPTSRTCQVLTITYAIEVEGKIGGATINPRIQIPITMGTIPLSMNAVPGFETSVVVQPVVVQPTAPSSSTADAPVMPSLPADLPPPSYEEVVNANRTNIQDEGETNEIGWRDYTPRYMVYRFSESVELPSGHHQPDQPESSVREHKFQEKAVM